MKIAVVGAGLSGVSFARQFLQQAASRDITLKFFEKSVAAGGRIATRRRESAAGEKWLWDHGAQYFTARDATFKQKVDDWVEKGVAAQLTSQIHVIDGDQPEKEPSTTSGSLERFVGTPKMKSIVEHEIAAMPDTVSVVFGTRVARMEPKHDTVTLYSDKDENLGTFDQVILSMPPPQVHELCQNAAPSLANAAKSVEVKACFAVMIQLSKHLDTKVDAAFVNNSSLSWITRTGSRPERTADTRDCWLLHGEAEYSTRRQNDEREEVADALIAEFARILNFEQQQLHIQKRMVHLWRYAIPTPIEQTFVKAETANIYCIGDWCGGPKVQGAFLSGYALANSLKAAL